MSSPYINHFLQPDTLIPDPSTPQAWNRYSYVLNNPIRYNDPTGHVVKCPICVLLQSAWDWYTGAGDGYDGPNGIIGPVWHGPKQVILNISDMDNNANNLPKFLALSMLHSKEAHLTEDALENIKRDPAMQVYDDNLMLDAESRYEQINEAFEYTYTELVEFGGDRQEVGMLAVALNQSAWELRHAYVEAKVNVDANGNINIDSYKINPGDVNDFKPSKDRVFSHNVYSVLFGIPYHYILGGSNKMKVYAEWQPD